MLKLLKNCLEHLISIGRHERLTVQGGGRQRHNIAGYYQALWDLVKMEASLNDAVCNVRQLETITLPDEQPQIEAPPASVTYISNFDTNFEDNKAFITCVSKYLEEADVHKGLVGVTYFSQRKAKLFKQTFIPRNKKLRVTKNGTMKFVGRCNV